MSKFLDVLQTLSDIDPDAFYEHGRYGSTYSVSDKSPKSMAAKYVDGSEYDLIWIVPYTSHGDYCGGFAEKSNHEVIEEEYNIPGLSGLSQGYGTQSLMIEVAELANELFTHGDDCDCADSDEWAACPVRQWEQFKEAMGSLMNYPSIDDDHLCKLESEAEEEPFLETVEELVRLSEADGEKEEALARELAHDALNMALGDGTVQFESEGLTRIIRPSAYRMHLEKWLEEVAGEITAEIRSTWPWYGWITSEGSEGWGQYRNEAQMRDAVGEDLRAIVGPCSGEDGVRTRLCAYR